MIISFFNPSDLIGCGGDINQSDSFRYAEGVRGGGTQRDTWRGYAEGYVEGVHGGGTWRGYTEGVRRGGTQRRHAEGVHGGVCRGGTRRGYALPIATIDLVVDNREFEV